MNMQEARAILMAYANDEPKATDREFKEAICMLIESCAATAHSHRCLKCDWAYTPSEGENEDCPACGYNGGQP